MSEEITQAYYALNCAVNLSGQNECVCNEPIEPTEFEAEKDGDLFNFIYDCSCDSNWNYTLKKKHRSYSIIMKHNQERICSATVSIQQAKNLMEND